MPSPGTRHTNRIRVSGFETGKHEGGEEQRTAQGWGLEARWEAGGWTLRAMRVCSREGGAEIDILPGREGPPTEYLLKGHCHIIEGGTFSSPGGEKRAERVQAMRLLNLPDNCTPFPEEVSGNHIAGNR